MQIIYFLIECDILEILRDNDNVHYCKFKHNYEINCYASASFYKPLLFLNLARKDISFNNTQVKLNLSFKPKRVPNNKYIPITLNKN